LSGSLVTKIDRGNYAADDSFFQAVLHNSAMRYAKHFFFKKEMFSASLEVLREILPVKSIVDSGNGFCELRNILCVQRNSKNSKNNCPTKTND
jgi:hypothetical protein